MFSIIFVVFLCVFFVLSVVSAYFQMRAQNSMTVEKFCKRVEELNRKRDFKSLTSFIKLHLGFLVLHSADINARLGSLPVENSKKED